MVTKQLIIKRAVGKQVEVCKCGEPGKWCELFQAYLCTRHKADALIGWLNSQSKMKHWQSEILDGEQFTNNLPDHPKLRA